MKTYKVGIIGFGGIGKVHAFAHQNMPMFFADAPFNTQITHVCTGHSDTADAAKRFLGAEKGTTDFREITENPDIDIVHICTPNHLHLESLISAMQAGKHIYCDKPLTATAEEAQQVEEILPSYHGIAQMTFQNRFFASAMRARQIITAGLLGRIFEFRVTFLHDSNIHPETPMKWKLSGAAGGGVIADLGSHALDFATYLAGDIGSVTALTSTAYAERPAQDDPERRVPVDAEDCMMVLARTRNNAIGTIEATKLGTGSEDELRAEVHGERGALSFNSMNPNTLGFYDTNQPDEPLGGMRGWTRIDCGQRYPAPAGFPSPKVSIGWLRSHVQCLYEFLAAVHEERPATPDLAHGIQIQRVMAAVRRSAETGLAETL